MRIEHFAMYVRDLEEQRIFSRNISVRYRAADTTMLLQVSRHIFCTLMTEQDLK